MRSYLTCRALFSPHESLLTLLIFILGIELGASPFQLALLACLKPATALVTYYLSFMISRYPNRFKEYLVLQSLLSLAPCLLFPLTDNIWYYIGSYAILMIVKRAIDPVWMEILKQRADLRKQSDIISFGNAIYYSINMVVPLLFGLLVDQFHFDWKYMFIATGIIQLASCAIIIRLNIQEMPQKTSLTIIAPIKDGWKLLKDKPQFAHYLALYFIGGAGLIGILPALPHYFKHELHINYTELTLAFSVTRGIAFLLTTKFWSGYFKRFDLYSLNTISSIFSCLFFICLFAASMNIIWLYAAYFFYGTMQSGAELSRLISGPVFAGNGESTSHSSMNLALIGVRGCICPLAGTLIFTYFNYNIAFFASFVFCFTAIFYGIWLKERYIKEEAFSYDGQ